jgi:hypothetical protein
MNRQNRDTDENRDPKNQFRFRSERDARRLVSSSVIRRESGIDGNNSTGFGGVRALRASTEKGERGSAVYP